MDQQQAENDYLPLGMADEHRLIMLIKGPDVGHRVPDQRNVTVRYIEALDFTAPYVKGLVTGPRVSNVRPEFGYVLTQALHEAIRKDFMPEVVALLGKTVIDSEGLYELFQMTGYVEKLQGTKPYEARRPEIFATLLQSEIFQRLSLPHKNMLIENLARLPEDRTKSIAEILDTYPEADREKFSHGFCLRRAVWNDHLKRPGAPEHVAYFLSNTTASTDVDKALSSCMQSIAANPTQEGTGQHQLVASSATQIATILYPIITKPVGEEVAIAALNTRIPEVFDVVTSEIVAGSSELAQIDPAKPGAAGETTAVSYDPNAILNAIFDKMLAVRPPVNNEMRLSVWNRCHEALSQDKIVAAAKQFANSDPEVFKLAIDTINDVSVHADIFRSATAAGSHAKPESKVAILEKCAEALSVDELHLAAVNTVNSGDVTFLGNDKSGLCQVLRMGPNKTVFDKKDRDGGNEMLFAAARYGMRSDNATNLPVTSKNIGTALGMMETIYTFGIDFCPNGMNIMVHGESPRSVMLGRIEKFAPEKANSEILRVLDLELRTLEERKLSKARVMGAGEGRLEVMRQALELSGGDTEKLRLMLSFLAGGTTPDTVERGGEAPRQLGDSRDQNREAGGQ